MATGEDWLLRPVLAGCCRYESLLDGTISLEDVAGLNEALDVQDENQLRYYKAKERERGS
jgi:hypothetical protein